jgi:hypothetical protein
MALTPRLANVGANAAATAVCALCNSGFVDIYDGTIPTNADTAIGAQVKLAHLAFGSTAFGTAAGGVATANTITSDTSADATGTASWFRAYESNGTTAVFDGSVGTSGCDLNLASVSIVIGGTVAVTAFTYTQAKS